MEQTSPIASAVLLRGLFLAMALTSLAPATNGPWIEKTPVPVIAPAKDLSNAHAFPVPFVPSQNQANVTFTNLVPQTTIRIFNIAGEEVRQLSNGSLTQLVWDMKNFDGEDVSSGVYLYLLSSSADEKTGKLMVIR